MANEVPRCVVITDIIKQYGNRWRAKFNKSLRCPRVARIANFLSLTFSWRKLRNIGESGFGTYLIPLEINVSIAAWVTPHCRVPHE